MIFAEYTTCYSHMTWEETPAIAKATMFFLFGVLFVQLGYAFRLAIKTYKDKNK